MKALFIGGTGTISGACVARALAKGWDVTVMNRGRSALPEGVRGIVCDITDEKAARAALRGQHYDCVAEFVGYTAQDARRDVRLFPERTSQYIYISSASAYQKPLTDAHITESTPLANPYWQYSRDKIAAEDVLNEATRAIGFPCTIVRPSHTYNERKTPVALHGKNGSWQVLQRMLQEKPVLIPGDGTSLWTLTHASDFAKGFAALMGNPHALGGAYHITSDERMTWNQIYGVLAAALGKPLRPLHVSSDFLAECGPQYDFAGQMLGDKANTVLFDNTKIKRLAPEFVCTVSMADGLRACAAYALAHPEVQTPDPAFDAWCDRVLAARAAARAAFLA